MGIKFNWLNKLPFANKMTGTDGQVFIGDVPVEQFYKEFAVESCISIIANAITMCEFNTFEKGKKVKKNNYYLFNIEPNRNQNAKEFWHEVISKLVYHNECLILQIDDQFFSADSFSCQKYAYYEDVYSDIVVRELSLERKYVESEVLYLNLNNTDIKKLIDSLYASYGKLLMSGIKNYKRTNGLKGFVEVDTTVAQTADIQTEMQNLMDKKFKQWFENDDAVLPLNKGFKFAETNKSVGQKDTRDIRKLIDDIIEFVCSAFHVPSGLVKGDVVGVEEQTNNFLTFCINPIAKLIEAEINRKVYGKKEFMKKSYIKIDTLRVKCVDLQKTASAGDLLFRIGTNSVNDNLEMLGREPINEAWANEHYVTKNYQSVLNINNPDIIGGDIDGKKNSKPKTG